MVSIINSEIENKLKIAVAGNVDAGKSSLIGVLKRTIERAPTNPRDKAREDLTTVIIKMVVSKIKGQTWENSSRLDKVDPKCLKCQRRSKDNSTPAPKLINNAVSDKGA